MATIPERLNPSLFDKLVADLDMPGLRDNVAMAELSRETMRHYSVPRLERFNENALRETVKRDLAWLLNTTNMAASVDLDPYPHVKTSVVNFGISDLSGKAHSHRVVLSRARDIRNAIRAFEPRIAEKSLHVEPSQDRQRENSVTYVIHGDITSAVQAMPVAFKTDVDADTSTITVRD